MKLSEAIRAGAKLRPQGFGHTHRDGKSCAVGAAYEAMTGKTDWPRDKTIYEYVADASGVPLHVVRYKIAEMNDSRKTREEIADWVEREYESKPPQKVRESDTDYTRRVLDAIVGTTPASFPADEVATNK